MVCETDVSVAILAQGLHPNSVWDSWLGGFASPKLAMCTHTVALFCGMVAILAAQLMWRKLVEACSVECMSRASTRRAERWVRPAEAAEVPSDRETVFKATLMNLLTADELKSLCRARHLKVTGTKTDLCHALWSTLR